MISLKDRLVWGAFYLEEGGRGGEKGRRERAEGRREEEGELTGRKNLVWKEEVVDEAN